MRSAHIFERQNTEPDDFCRLVVFEQQDYISKEGLPLLSAHLFSPPVDKVASVAEFASHLPAHNSFFALDIHDHEVLKLFTVFQFELGCLSILLYEGLGTKFPEFLVLFLKDRLKHLGPIHDLPRH